MFTVLVNAPTGSAAVDRPEIQKAVDTVSAAGGGQVSLRAGTYAVDRAINLQNNVLLRGSGNQATTLLFAGGNLAALTEDVVQYRYAVIRIIGKQGVGVADLRIDGNKCKRKLAAGVIIPFCPGIAIRAAGMTDFSTPQGEPSHIQNSQAAEDESHDCFISRCIVEACPGTGILIQGARRIVASDCETYNNGDFGIYAGGYTHFCRFMRCTSRRNYHGALEFSEGSRHHVVQDSILSNVILQNFGDRARATYHRVQGCIIGPCHVGDAVVINGHSYASVEGCTIVADSGCGVTVFCKGLPGYAVAHADTELPALVHGLRISNNVIVASPIITRSLVTRIGRELLGPPYNYSGNLRVPLQDTFAALAAAGKPANPGDPVDPQTGAPAAHLPRTAAELAEAKDALAALGSWAWATPLPMVQMILECIEYEAHELPRFLVYSPQLPGGATAWETILNFLPDAFFDLAPAVESSLEVQYPWDLAVARDRCRHAQDDRGRSAPGPAGIFLQYAVDSIVSGNRVLGPFPVGLLLFLSREISATGNMLVGSDQWGSPSPSGLVASPFVNGHMGGWMTANRPYGFGILILKSHGSSISGNTCRGFDYGMHEGVGWGTGEAPIDPQTPAPEVGFNFVLDNRVEENNHPYGTKQLTSKYREF